MQRLPLQAIPNQQFSITLDGLNYTITFKACGGIMAVTIVRQGIEILTNSLCPAGQLLLSYPYAESGNFFIDTINDELPYYNAFGITQQLYYLSQIELVTARG